MKCRHFSYLDISLIQYGSEQPVNKGVQLIEVALYWNAPWPNIHANTCSVLPKLSKFKASKGGRDWGGACGHIKEFGFPNSHIKGSSVLPLNAGRTLT